MLLLGFLSTALFLVDAIIIHPDVEDSKYIVDVATAPFFVAVGGRGNCGGALVAGAPDAEFSYVVSAAHCFCADGQKTNQPSSVSFFDGSQVMIGIIFHPLEWVFFVFIHVISVMHFSLLFSQALPLCYVLKNEYLRVIC